MSKEDGNRRRLYLPYWSIAVILAGAARYGVARVTRLLSELPRLTRDTPLRGDLDVCWHQDPDGLGLVYVRVEPARLVVLGVGPRDLGTTGPAMLRWWELVRAGLPLRRQTARSARLLEPLAVIGHGVVAGFAAEAEQIKAIAERWCDEWENGTPRESPGGAWEGVEFPALRLAALVRSSQAEPLRELHKQLTSKR